MVLKLTESLCLDYDNFQKHTKKTVIKICIFFIILVIIRLVKIIKILL
jgi:hypothetical protein